jgi:transcription elongation factor Elf1
VNKNEIYEEISSRKMNEFLNKVDAETDKVMCDHKDSSYTILLNKNSDGSRTCSKCGETFTLLDPAKLDIIAIEDICANINDLFQTIKAMTICTPENKDFYIALNFISKLPEMYKMVSENFEKLASGKFDDFHIAPFECNGINMVNAMTMCTLPEGYIQSPFPNLMIDQNISFLSCASLKSLSDAIDAFNNNPETYGKIPIEIAKDYFIKFFNFTEDECELIDLQFIYNFLNIAKNEEYDEYSRRLWCQKIVDLFKKKIAKAIGKNERE